MKKFICILAIITLVICAVSMPVSADSATIALSKSNVTPGSNVTVTITYKASFAMYAIDISLKYNSSVLQYVSGGGNNTGSTVKIVEGLSGEKSKSFKVVFKAIAAGSGSLSLTATASGEGDGSASAGATVTVAAAVPSSNANLGSLEVSGVTLTPEFKPATTDYNAEVKFNVDKITISANAAVGDSTVTGAGTFDLKVGNNSNIITVTAASGAKKTYTVNIKRMTEEETAAALAEERKNSPYLFIDDNGDDRFLVPDLSGMASYSGYTVKTVERKGAQVSYFADDAGSYSLFWATDENGDDGAFYNNLSFYTGRNDVEAFKRVNCLKSGDRLYIIKPFAADVKPGNQFVKSDYKINGEEVECYKYKDESLSGFYVFYCYCGGKSDYYMLDTLQGTVQREPTFLIDINTTSNDAFARISRLSTQGKIVLDDFVLSGFGNQPPFNNVYSNEPPTANAQSGKSEFINNNDDF